MGVCPYLAGCGVGSLYISTAALLCVQDYRVIRGRRGVHGSALLDEAVLVGLFERLERIGFLPLTLRLRRLYANEHGEVDELARGSLLPILACDGERSRSVR